MEATAPSRRWLSTHLAPHPPRSAIRLWPFFALLSQRLRHVCDGMGRCGQQGKPGRPAGGIDRPRQQRRGQHIDRLTELFPRDGMRLSLVRNSGKSFRNNTIASSIPANRSPSRRELINSRHLLPSTTKCPAGLPLSTDDTYFGSSGWRVRVIPVVEVPVEQHEPVHGRQRGLQPFGCSRVPSQPRSRAARVESR